jgi:hypothetical protein
MMPSQGIDQADLYDHEIVSIGKVWQALNAKWGPKPNTRGNLQEFAKEANAAFLDLGFVVNVMWENNLMIDPRTMQPFPIEIEILGRVPGGSGLGEQKDGFELMDHERKRDQVLKSIERGEKYHPNK